MPTSRAEHCPRPDARLLAAAEMIRPGSTAADIGCDHGKLSAWLASSGRCPRVIAVDLRAAPLARARETCLQAGCLDRVELRQGDGLCALSPGEAQDIVVAGLGAVTTIQLLEAAPWVRDPALNLVLVPATRHEQLRAWLAQNGFALIAERPVRRAGRLYTVMNARYTGQCIRPDGRQCVVGRISGPLAGAYLRDRLGKLKKLRRGLTGAQRAALDMLIEQLEEEYAVL